MERTIRMDALARYYTEEKISRLLIDKFHEKNPKNILELGIGNGSLSLAAYSRWNSARFIGVDVDSKSIVNIKNKLPFVEIIDYDGLNDGIQMQLNIDNCAIDIAICNPPYLKHKISDKDRLLLESVSLGNEDTIKYITTDIIFLAQNLMLLGDGCELGIILPDSIMTNHYFCSLRRDLLRNHNVKSIIQLPDNIFSKTEVRTHIMIVEKNRKGKVEVEVAKANSDGEITHSLRIDKNKLVQRMDFDFHYWVSQLIRPIRNYLTIDDVVTSLSRGNKTKKYLQNLQVPYFHTTSFNEYGNYLSVDFSQTDFPPNISLATPGDILIARVGKRCIGKVAMVKHGFIPFSDCIYRLKVTDEYRTDIFKSLLSTEGQSWLQANAHGVCARVISKKDLLQYPIVNV